MNKIKLRTAVFSVSILLLSSFLVAKIAINTDFNRDAELTTAANSGISERSSIASPLKQTTNNLDELYRQAAQAQPDLSRITRNIANQLGGEASIPKTLKTRERAEEKIATDYGGDAARITDLARSSIIFETESQVLEALEILQDDMKVIRIKNRFQKPVNGYRDVLLNVLMPNGHIAEMQLHLRSILEVKYKFGDELYREIRTIEADAKTEQRDLNALEAKRIKELSTQAKELYDRAFEQSKLQ